MIDLKDYISKAELCEKNSKWDEAIILYKQIIKEDCSIKNLERLGWCLSRNSNFDEAIEAFQKLSEKDPKTAKWKYMIGYQYYCEKKWNKCIQYFEEALDLKSDYFVVKYRLSYAYIQIAGTYKKLTKAEF